MLIDLTRVSGQRVSQVDELRLGERHWIRTTDIYLFGGGLLAGAFAALPLRILFGGVWMFFLAPVAGVIAVFLFSRKRSVEGERTRRRFDRMMDRRRSMSGEFMLPGPAGRYEPNGYMLIEFHDHPIWRGSTGADGE